MRGRGVELAASDRNVKIYQRERIRKREREREIGILSPSSRQSPERWRIIIWIERHGWRGKFNMQIARHYASFIPVFRSWRGGKGREEASGILRLPSLSFSRRTRVGLESWWMKRGSERDSWIKGKTRWGMDVDEQSPNLVLHIRFITPEEESNTLYIYFSLSYPFFTDLMSVQQTRDEMIALLSFIFERIGRWNVEDRRRGREGGEKRSMEPWIVEGSGRFPSSGVI